MESSLFEKLRPGKFKKVYSSLVTAYKSYFLLCRKLPSFFRDGWPSKPKKRILIAGSGYYGAPSEAIYAAALGLKGYETFVITQWDPFVAKIFRLFGIVNVIYYNSYNKHLPLNDFIDKAKQILNDLPVKDILQFTHKDSYCGKYAASSFMRITRKSNFIFSNDKEKEIFVKQLASSLRACEMANSVIKEVKPDLLFITDRGYTPEGQIFDVCLHNNISVIQRCGSHKSGWEILKRYSSLDMSRHHHHSLSEESWAKVKGMPWNEQLWRKLHDEIKSTYVSGDWFSEVGTQFNKKLYSKEELLVKLGLSSDKKTAVIFPHIFWDATFFWGEDLFADYYDWFINVLKAAKENTNLNWIIKIHPANTVKAKRDNYRGEQKELSAVREILGELPKHIKLIPSESDINTFSLFALADYCLTVRGTTGIESAMFGIKTLTAGTGRYDRLGFTEDFYTKEEYLKCIENLQELPSMDYQQIESARRFAYGAFILRPCHIDICDYGYCQDERATIRFSPIFKTKREFVESDFVRKFCDFVSSGKEDFMDWGKVN